MRRDGANYTIRNGKRHDTCNIRVWDPILKKQVYHSEPIPEGLSGKKLEAFCLNEMKKFQDQVLYRTSVAPSNTTFGDFFCGEWSDYKISQGRDLTLKDYRNLYDVHLSKSLGNVPLDRITPRLLQGIYAERRASGVSVDRVLRMHKLIKQVLEDAKKRGIIDENVAKDRMDSPEHPQRISQYDENVLGEEDVQKIINAINEMDVPILVI